MPSSISGTFSSLVVTAILAKRYRCIKGKRERRASHVSRLLPGLNLHGTILHKVGVHFEYLVEHMGLVTHPSSHTLAGSKVQVVLELILVVRMSAFINCGKELLNKTWLQTHSPYLSLSIALFSISDTY
jgi:hypothetical protein